MQVKKTIISVLNLLNYNVYKKKIKQNNEVEYYDEYELSKEFADKIKLLPYSKKPNISTKTLTKAYDCR